MTLARSLGVEYAAIFHVDDVGMCHGANRGFLELAEHGFVTCGSVMVPCPWFREIAEAVGGRLDLPVVSVPEDVLMLPGYFGPVTNLVTMDVPVTNLITRETLGWEPTQPTLMADLDNGNYFAAS